MNTGFTNGGRFAPMALLLIALATTALATTARADDTGRAVYHVDFADTGRYSLTLTSVNNMIDAWDQELRPHQISIVFVGQGLRFVTDDPLTGTPFAADADLEAQRAELKGRLTSLHKVRDVDITVCGNTLREAGLSKDELYDGVTVVPSGVAHIADLDNRGAAYLKIR